MSKDFRDEAVEAVERNGVYMTPEAAQRIDNRQKRILTGGLGTLAALALTGASVGGLVKEANRGSVGEVTLGDVAKAALSEKGAQDLSDKQQGITHFVAPEATPVSAVDKVALEEKLAGYGGPVRAKFGKPSAAKAAPVLKK